MQNIAFLALISADKPDLGISKIRAYAENMPLNLVQIDRVADIDRPTFRQQYLKPRTPVVMSNLAKTWPAYSKWNFDYFKHVAGDQIVPLYDGSKTDGTKKVNEPDAQMKFADYLDLIAREPSQLRIFLFNIVSHMPDVKKDYTNPPFCDWFVDQFPAMFFGGGGSSVFMHYDIDAPSIFHTHFVGRKRVTLVSPEFTPLMYKLPLSWHAIEDINWRDPDFDQFPALRGVTAHTTILEHGETLYMPKGWWHFMEYLDGGFSISLRALVSPAQVAEAAYNVAVVKTVDNFFRKRYGKQWFEWKEKSAAEKANKRARRLNLPVPEAVA
ncbi:MAG: cupin [Phycisphaerales bacterium]|nr:cupin [Phycisphaerales bacterium]